MPITYPIMIRNYINELCSFLGIRFANDSDTFVNYNKTIPNELYLDTNGNSIGYTFRDVLDELAQVTASTICLNDNDELEIRYINDTGDTIDEEFLKNVNVNFGERYGKVNSIVLSRSGESDNVYLRDETSVSTNGLTELKIVDNQIMNFNNRDEFLPEILGKLNGLEYYLNDFASTGIAYYDLCDRYNVKVGDNTYSCVMFNNEMLVTQGLEENIFTEMPQETETNYTKADKTDRKISQAYLIVDKQNQTIEAVTKKVEKQETEIKDNYYTKTTTNELLQEAVEGLTNKYSLAGGNNYIKDSMGVLNDGSWNNISSITDTFTRENAVGQSAIMLQDTTSTEDEDNTIRQKINCKNGIYTLSFSYLKLIELAECKIKINNIEYNLIEDNNLTKFSQVINVSTSEINIEFICDTNNACYIIDLMLNDGEEPLTWSQNANETITDTVKIGKGIQVESSSTNTISRMDSDGTRVLNKTTGEVVREDTDRGTVTNEFESRSTSKVNGMLVLKVGSQVWLNGV